MKKILKILLIIFLPLGIIYCIGKNLFGGSAAAFAGGVLLAATGVIFGIWLMNPDIFMNILNAVRDWLHAL